MTSRTIDHDLSSGVTDRAAWRQRGDRLYFGQRRFANREHADFRVGLVVHIEKAIVARELQAAGPGTGMRHRERRVSWNDGRLPRVNAIHIHAIEPEIGHVHEATVLAEFDTMHFGARLVSGQRRTAMLID